MSAEWSHPTVPTPDRKREYVENLMLNEGICPTTRRDWRTLVAKILEHKRVREGFRMFFIGEYSDDYLWVEVRDVAIDIATNLRMDMQGMES